MASSVNVDAVVIDVLDRPPRVHLVDQPEGTSPPSTQTPTAHLGADPAAAAKGAIS